MKIIVMMFGVFGLLFGSIVSGQRDWSRNETMRWRKSATDEYYYRLVSGPLETLDLRKDGADAADLCKRTDPKDAWRVMHGWVTAECHDEARTEFTLKGYNDNFDLVIIVEVPNKSPEGYEGNVFPRLIRDPYNSRHAKWTVVGPLLPEP